MRQDFSSTAIDALTQQAKEEAARIEELQAELEYDQLQAASDRLSEWVPSPSTYVPRIEAMNKATETIFAPIKFMPNDRLEIELTDDGKYFICLAFAMLNGRKGPASTHATKTWALRIPERAAAGHGRWKMRATDMTAVIIHQVWNPEHVTMTKAAAATYEVLLLRFMQQSVHARMRAKFKIERELPTAPDTYYDHPDLPLSPYQTCAAVTSIDTEGTALFCEQGTGKTPIVIRRINHESLNVFRDEKRMYRAIIVCPRNVRGNWRNELIKFATLPGKVTVLRGGQLKRVKRLVDAMTPDEDSHWSVVITSYETLKRSWEAIKLVEWDLAVADESHMFKSSKAERGKYMLKLRERSNQRMCLTGTPMANQIADYYMQLEFLGQGMSGFSSWKNFREYYSRFVQQNNEVKVVGVDLEKLPLFQERLSRLAFMVTKAEALPDLPDKMYDCIEAQMSPTQRKYYEQMQKHLAAEIEEDLRRAEDSDMPLKVTANNVLTKLLRLSQITAGYVVSDEVHNDLGEEINTGEQRVHFFKDNPKMDELIEVLKNKGPKEKTIIWTCWVPVIYELSRRLDEAGIKHVKYFGKTKDEERDQIEYDWNHDPELKVFIGNPAAGGVGLNLPGYVPEHDGTDLDHGCNADHTIFYACNWSMIQRSQAEDRNHGKNRCRMPIRVTDIVIPGTIDEEIRRRVLAKILNAMEISNLRDLLESLLETNPDEGD